MEETISVFFSCIFPHFSYLCIWFSFIYNQNKNVLEDFIPIQLHNNTNTQSYKVSGVTETDGVLRTENFISYALNTQFSFSIN